MQSIVLALSLVLVADAPRDKCAHFREINGIAAAFQHLQKNYIPAALSFL
ncbi:glucosamine-6-phosphate deaminase [Escherichia coli]